jgi:hypothetical protein
MTFGSTLLGNLSNDKNKSAALAALLFIDFEAHLCRKFFEAAVRFFMVETRLIIFRECRMEIIDGTC